MVHMAIAYVVEMFAALGAGVVTVPAPPAPVRLSRRERRDWRALRAQLDPSGQVPVTRRHQAHPGT